MSYFTAVLARDGRKWFAHDLEVEAADDLGELADGMRGLSFADDQPVLAVVEREDVWWAVVRVDGEEDPRVFVSDVQGVAASPYADVLAIEEDEDEEEEPEGCAGDFDVLADLGTSPDDLRRMCDDEVLPVDALTTVAEAAGFLEVLDSLR